MDPVRRRLSFSRSPSPSPSPPAPSPSSSNNNNSSRLSKEEINEILNSPYETGYTYSESAAYRHDAPTEFMHPRLCRRIVSTPTSFEPDRNLLSNSRSNDAYSRRYASTVNYALKEYGPLKPKARGALTRLGTLISDLPSHVYGNGKSTIRVIFFYIISLIQYGIMFTVNLAVSSAGGGWELTKMVAWWVFKYFVLAPILGPYYLIMKHYRKAQHAYSFSMWTYSTIRSIVHWFQNIRRRLFPVTLERTRPIPSAPPIAFAGATAAAAAASSPSPALQGKEARTLNGGGGSLLQSIILWPFQEYFSSSVNGGPADGDMVGFEPVGTRTRSHYSKYTTTRISSTTTQGRPVSGRFAAAAATPSRTVKKTGVIGWTKWVYTGGIPKSLYYRARENPSRAKQYAKIAFVWIPLALLLLYLLSHAWLRTNSDHHYQQKQQQQQIRQFPLSTIDALSKRVTSHGDYLFSSAYHKAVNTFGGTFRLIADGSYSLVSQILRGIGLAGIFVAEFVGRVGSLLLNTLQWIGDSLWSGVQWTWDVIAGAFNFTVHLTHSTFKWIYNAASDTFAYLLELNHSILKGIYGGVCNVFNLIIHTNHAILRWGYNTLKRSGGSAFSYLSNSVQWLLNLTHNSLDYIIGGVKWLFNYGHNSFNYITGSIIGGANNLWVYISGGVTSTLEYLVGKIPIDRREYPSLSPSPAEEEGEEQAEQLRPSPIHEEIKMDSIPDDHPIMAKIKNLIDSTLAEERKLMEERLRQRVGEVQQEAASQSERLRDEYEAKISKLIGEEKDLVANGANAGGEEWLKELEKGMDKKLDHLISLINSKVTEQNSKFTSELEELRNSYSVLIHHRGASHSQFQSQLGNSGGDLHHLKRAHEMGDNNQMEQVRQMIKEYIQRYDADKTGLPDYALESSGGAIASIRCTIPYNERSRTQMIFGIPLWYSSYSPRSVIQRKGHGASAGECWAFEGPHGYLVIKLSQRINVTAVSYEHLPVQLSPDGHIKTAPKQFLVYSYQDVDDLQSRFLLGNFTYDDAGEPLQMFQMQHHDPRMTPIVELETLSNYGAMVTCLYRFRVHGNLPASTDNNNKGN